jgi:endoglycosylceramidase
MTARWCLLSCLLQPWTVSASFTGASSLSWIRSSATPGDFHFYDEHGRRRIFHGSNRVRKSPPWYIPEMATDDATASHMRSLGLSVVRLGFMWSGYNPRPGEYNQTYIDIIKATVNRLSRFGVYSLLNVQMDGLSSKFCTYDGVPLWVIDKATPPAHPFPWPLSGNCSKHGSLDVNIATEASVSAYQDIFDNNHGMLDDFVAFWSHAAEQFKDMPGVIGYDLMNEPFAGNFYKDPELLLPGVAGRKNLQRMYDSAAAAIRVHDDRHIIFYEPTTWGMVFSGKLDGSGFQHVPGGDAYRNRSAYS